jgi:hypothetical protein
MAKDRATKAEGRQKETKVSEDKVKKPQKETKLQPVAKTESEDSDSSEDEAVVEQEVSGTPPLRMGSARFMCCS